MSAADEILSAANLELGRRAREALMLKRGDDSMSDHAALAAAAVAWAQAKGCYVVLCEPRSIPLERPDVIGWTRDASYLFECKSDRSDFLHDATKATRRDLTNGVGNFRYYVAPSSLIAERELSNDFGLLEVDLAGTVTETVPAACQSCHGLNERTLLLEAFRRSQLGAGVLIDAGERRESVRSAVSSLRLRRKQGGLCADCGVVVSEIRRTDKTLFSRCRRCRLVRSGRRRSRDVT